MAVKDIRAAKRYATALFDAADKENKRDIVTRDIFTVLELMEKSPSLRQLWDSPLIPSGRKRELLRSTLETNIDPLTLSFLRLLVDKRREETLEAIGVEIRQLTDAANHLIRAEATFAVPPTEAELQALNRSLAQRTGRSIELTVEINPSIIGGVVVRMQDTIIDGSVRGTLERLREQLLTDA